MQIVRMPMQIVMMPYRIIVAADTETPTPNMAAYATKHSGHFGSSTSVIAGKSAVSV